MPNISLNKQPSNIIHLQINRISYLAFVEIFFKYDFLSYEIKPADGFYVDSRLKYEVEYANIMNALINIAKVCKNDDVLPFGSLLEAQIALSTHSLPVFTDKLNNSPLAELRGLGTELCQLSGIVPLASNNDSLELNDVQPKTNKTESGIWMLDKDNSFENKLIFHHLFPTQTDPIEKIAEKAEMMTPEQKEKIFERILNQDGSIILPKSILHQSFCTMEIVAPFSEIRDLIKCPQMKMIASDFTVDYGVVAPDYIIHSNQYEAYLSAVEQIKKYFVETNNRYAIPLTFKQRLIASVDLHFLNVLKNSKSILAEKIFSEVVKNFPFINIK